jgi:hypothetical protein
VTPAASTPKPVAPENSSFESARACGHPLSMTANSAADGIRRPVLLTVSPCPFLPHASLGAMSPATVLRLRSRSPARSRGGGYPTRCRYTKFAPRRPTQVEVPEISESLPTPGAPRCGAQIRHKRRSSRVAAVIVGLAREPRAGLRRA